MVVGFQLLELKLEKLETLSFPALPMRRSIRHFALYHHVIHPRIKSHCHEVLMQETAENEHFGGVKVWSAVGCVCLRARACYLYSCRTHVGRHNTLLQLFASVCWSGTKNQEHWLVISYGTPVRLCLRKKNAILIRWLIRKWFNKLQWKGICILFVVSAAFYWRLCGETGRGNSQTTKINLPLGWSYTGQLFELCCWATLRNAAVNG